MYLSSQSRKMGSELFVDPFEKEEAMDKYNFAKLVANERKNQIDRELAVRHMLKDAGVGMFRISKTRRLVMRLVPAVIFISILAILMLA